MKTPPNQQDDGSPALARRDCSAIPARVGEIVEPILGRSCLRSGGSAYEDAVVVSVSPFVLISREGDMLWAATVTPEDYAVSGFADNKTLAKCLRRLAHDVERGWPDLLNR